MSRVTQLSDAIVYSMLLKVNPSKSSGSDEVPNWILKDYAGNVVCAHYP